MDAIRESKAAEATQARFMSILKPVPGQLKHDLGQAQQDPRFVPHNCWCFVETECGIRFANHKVAVAKGNA